MSIVKKESYSFHLSIIVAIMGIVMQAAMWMFYGGRLTERVDNIDKRQDKFETAQTTIQTTANAQQIQISAQTVKLDYIKSTVDTMNGKLDGSNKR